MAFDDTEIGYSEHQGGNAFPAEAQKAYQSPAPQVSASSVGGCTFRWTVPEHGLE